MKNDSTIAEKARDFALPEQHAPHSKAQENAKPHQDTHQQELDLERRLERAIGAARCTV